MMSLLRETESRFSASANPACSICGTLNAHGAAFCRCCGVSITHVSEAVATLEGGGFCEACQCTHATPARFCDHCGGKLPGYLRPPDFSGRNVGEAASIGSADVAGTLSVAARPKAGRTFVPSVQPDERRSSTARYLLLSAICAATVAGMYSNGYRLTRADAGQHASLQATVSTPAAAPYQAASLLPAAQSDAIDDGAAIDAALVHPTPSRKDTGIGAQADQPATAAAEPSGRRTAAQRFITEEAYEAPVSAIRELPAMPIHDFKSVVQLDSPQK